MNQFKIKLSRSVVEGVMALIEQLLTASYEADDDKLLMANLSEFRDCLYKKLCKVQPMYSLTLAPAHAIALRLVYVDFINDNSTQIGAALMLISNQVHKTYL